MKKIYIYSDGASKNNGSKNPNEKVIGSYAYIMVSEEHFPILNKKEAFFNVTNNQMELFGFIQSAYDFFIRYKNEEQYEITIKSDSQYLVKGVNEWMNSWKNKNWKNVKNLDLWLLIDSILNYSDKVKFKFEWIKGHSGKKVTFNENPSIYYNEKCDSNATEIVKILNENNDLKVRDFKKLIKEYTEYFKREK